MCIQRDSVAARFARLRKRALGGRDELDVLPCALAVGHGDGDTEARRQNGLVGEAGFG